LRTDGNIRSVRPQADGARPAKAGRYVSVLIVVIAIALTGSACRQDMHDQPKYTPLRSTPFFGDVRSARPLIAGTVAQGQLHEDPFLETGKIGNADATVFPFPVDEAVMARGRERFEIFCTPCHGRTGTATA